MPDQSTAWSRGYSAGYAQAMEKAARIADGHRALQLNSGRVEAGLACSSVAAFIIQEAREKGLWRESLSLPLVLSDEEIAEKNSGTKPEPVP